MSYLDAILAGVAASAARDEFHWLGDYAPTGVSLSNPVAFNEALRAATAAAHASEYKTVVIPSGTFTLDLDELNANGAVVIDGSSTVGYNRSVAIRGAGLTKADTMLIVPDAYQGILFDFDSFGGGSRYTAPTGRIQWSYLGQFSVRSVGSTYCAATVARFVGALYTLIYEVGIYDFFGLVQDGRKVHDWIIGTGIECVGTPGTENAIEFKMRDCEIYRCMSPVRMYAANASSSHNTSFSGGCGWGFLHVDDVAMSFFEGDWSGGDNVGSGFYQSNPHVGTTRYGCETANVINGWTTPMGPRHASASLSASASGLKTIAGLDSIFSAADIGSYVFVTGSRYVYPIVSVPAANQIVIEFDDSVPEAVTGAAVVYGGRYTGSISAPSGGRVTVSGVDMSGFHAGNPSSLVGRWVVLEGLDSGNAGAFRCLDIANINGSITTWAPIIEKYSGGAEASVRFYVAGAFGGNAIAIGGQSIYCEALNGAFLWVEPGQYGSNSYELGQTSRVFNSKHLVKSVCPTGINVAEVVRLSGGIPPGGGTYDSTVVNAKSLTNVTLSGFANNATQIDGLFKAHATVRSGLTIAGGGRAYGGSERGGYRDPFQLLKIRGRSPAYWDSEHGLALSGTDVQTWTDRINGIVANPFNGGVFPQYTASHSVFGLPAVEFDTAASASKAAFTATLTSSHIADGAFVGLFCVFALPSITTGNFRRIMLTNGGTNYWVLAPYETSAMYIQLANTLTPTTDYGYAAGHSANASTAYSASDPQFGMLVEGYSNHRSYVYSTVQNTSMGSYARRVGSGNLTLYIGSGAAQDQQAWSLLAVAVLTTPLTLAELQELHFLLEDKYGIASNNGIAY